MKSNNKVSIDLDLEDLFGLKDNKNTLEYDLNFIIDNGIDEYLKQQQEHEKKKQEFIALFKECYDDIVKIIDKDPKQRIAVDCYGCKTWGKDLSHHYHIQSKEK